MDVTEAFSHGTSLLHRLDPRIKWISVLAFSVVVALSDRLAAVLPALGLSLSLLVISRLPLRAVAGRLLAVNVFVALMWVFLPFTVEGEVIGALAGLPVTQEGVALAVLLTVKSNAIMAAIMALPGTSSVFDNIHAFHHLRLPAKLVQLLFFTFRYVHVIGQEYSRLRTAMRVRGFRVSTTVHTWRSLSYLLGMLLVRSFERSERVHAAMLCRGFRGTFYTLHHFRLRPSDLAFGFAAVAAVFAIAGIQWMM